MGLKPLKEYQKEEKVISEECEEKSRKILKKYLISLAALFILANSFAIVNNTKSKNLEKNYPIHQVYTDNQSSLKYLKNKLDQYKPEKFPEFLPKEVKNELENISIQEDSAKISSLEKMVEITEQDAVGITNTPEFKEYLEKREKIEKNEDFFLLGIMGSGLASLPGFIFIRNYYTRRKNEKLKTLREEYEISPPSQ